GRTSDPRQIRPAWARDVARRVRSGRGDPVPRRRCKRATSPGSAGCCSALLTRRSPPLSPARPLARPRSASRMRPAALTRAACSNKQRLGEYDYRGRTLAVATIAPPHPEVFSGASLARVDANDPIELVLRAGSEAVREVSAHRAREKLDRVARDVDV